mmetsp:Transcript_32857/g.91995  ORF Transcript_32857/g.91995 Transcript_32857/m.91995 type:complete len:403 (+) Transcript_32857:39-1247(+)
MATTPVLTAILASYIAVVISTDVRLIAVNPEKFEGDKLQASLEESLALSSTKILLAPPMASAWVGYFDMDLVDWFPAMHYAFVQLNSEVDVYRMMEEKNFTGPSLPTATYHPREVARYIGYPSEQAITGFVNHLSGYWTRYYKSEDGVEASFWIVEQLETWAGGQDFVDIQLVHHADFPQPSIIARLNPPEDSPFAGEIVILGCHFDSINSQNTSAAAPGADDNASGTAALLEVYRSLVTHGFRPAERTIEFHFYAGEEEGLLGSMEIAQAYREADKNVVAMLQYDCIGYAYKQEVLNTIRLVYNQVSVELSDYVKLLIDTYTTMASIPFVCPWPCSDYYSYYVYNYKSTFTLEPKQNFVTHTAKDVPDKVDMGWVQRMSRLAISYIVELAYALPPTISEEA